MSFNSTPMIQELRADFEKVLNMVTCPEAATATLDQMERSVLRQILRLGLKLLKLFVQTRVAAEEHKPLRAGRKHWDYHSQKERDYFSFFGKLTFARAYFYSQRHGGRYPLDEALSVPDSCYSDLLMESAELLTVEGSYAKGVRGLARLLDIALAEAAVETSVAVQSAAVEDFYAQQVPPPVKDEGVLLVAQADGKGVPMVRPTADAPAPVRRGKGAKKTRKKEAIATSLYTLDRYRRTSQEVVDALFRQKTPAAARPVPCGKRVFASLDGKTAALERLANWAQQRAGEHIRGRVALTDGSLALQAQTQTNLPDFTLVLDVLHANEHLWKAGTALHGETNPQRALWVEAQVTDLLASRGKTVINNLTKEPPTTIRIAWVNLIVVDRRRPGGWHPAVPLAARCVRWPTTCSATCPTWTTPPTCGGVGPLAQASWKALVAIWSKTAWNCPACAGRCQARKLSWPCGR